MSAQASDIVANAIALALREPGCSIVLSDTIGLLPVNNELRKVLRKWNNETLGFKNGSIIKCLGPRVRALGVTYDFR